MEPKSDEVHEVLTLVCEMEIKRVRIDDKHYRERVKCRMRLSEELGGRFRVEYINHLIQNRSLDKEWLSVVGDLVA
ncbi:hypothetical protein TNCV_2290861 [Trichonephila clavipes]|uniref:Uncharacterized protein n=1 Tax=Trichonephila clavipes TaxID=2585209 RepID=A0A8X6V6F0_TRICX|nr:hypothetical protein TNCV_2290861 [Trichonephila clavipes]